MLWPSSAFSLETPKRGKFDSRVRSIPYNESQVTLINGHFGFTTHIQFGEDEAVTDVAMGDPTAWACEVRKNHIFLKPSGENADTNMSVLTNQRVYVFDLKAYKSNAKVDKFYLITFEYPEQERLKAEALAREKALKDKLAEGSKVIPDNWNYWKIGHESIAPVEAFDDKTFTYLTFPNNRDFPAVYKENLDGTEALLNSHVEGNTVIIHGIVQKIVLRKGNLAAAVVNASFDPDGTYNDSGMTVNGFKRVVKGGN